MSDAPLQNASINPATGLPRKADPRDVADIDRELEAYLAEKRSSQSVSLDHSVDGQLSRIKEKVSARLEQNVPQGEKAVPQADYGLPPIKPSEAKPAGTISTAKKPLAQNTPPSHEDLIRSLEEKYSTGKETGPQNKKEALAPEVATTPVKEEGKIIPETNREGSQLVAAKAAPVQSVPKDSTLQNSAPTKIVMPPEVEKVFADVFAELKASIDPENKAEILQLLESATALSPADQNALVQVFLPRFRRNKERKELFLRTKEELEQELRAFTNKRLDANKESFTPQNQVTQTPAQVTQAEPKQFAILDDQKRTQVKPPVSETERASLPVHDPFSQYVKEEKPAQREVPAAEKAQQAEVPSYAEVPTKELAPALEQNPVQKTEQVPVSNVAVETPQTTQEKPDPSAAVIERYKQFLINSDRKPTVLVYDPEQGFVRKAIDPNDTSLNLSFSFDQTTRIVTLQVLDKNGILLSEIRTPESEF